MKFNVIGSANVAVSATVEAESLEEAQRLAEDLPNEAWEYNSSHPETPPTVDYVGEA